MNREHSSRNYKGGSWDLRKQERRHCQETIGFPNRRENDRRATSQNRSQEMAESLTWVRPPGLDV